MRSRTSAGRASTRDQGLMSISKNRGRTLGERPGLSQESQRPPPAARPMLKNILCFLKANHFDLRQRNSFPHARRNYRTPPRIGSVVAALRRLASRSVTFLDHKPNAGRGERARAEVNDVEVAVVRPVGPDRLHCICDGGWPVGRQPGKFPGKQQFMRLSAHSR